MDINEKLVPHFLKKFRRDLTPPGCLKDFVESPIDPTKLCVQVGMFYEHRFAFYFWARFYQEYIVSNKYKFKNNPILVTLDYHNDVGADNDCKNTDLEQLNLSDKRALGMFCWSYLNPLNDGQILPSLYLNFFSDVYVLNTKKIGTDRTYLDRYSKKHEIKYFHEIESLTMQLDSVNTSIYLDIDLDYFTNYEDSGSIKGSAKIQNLEEIRKTLKINNPLMSRICPRLVGLTIALEPEHTGGFKQSMYIFDLLNSELFNGTLLTDSCKWNF